ncbi:MAG TPA: hypothetical protein VMM76_24660 [Pirellulaceae bacterium]|nr:hypothetical protein [Pirellulaceae bacterium]
MFTDHTNELGTSRLRERYREWLPGTLTTALLLGVAKTAQIADRHHWWFRDEYELLSLIVFTAFTAATCIGFLTLFRISHPQTDYYYWSRIAVTVFFSALAMNVGGRYLHLCTAGSRVIEGLAMFGSPVLVGAIVFSIKRRGIASFIATFTLVIIWLLARPYLDWAHGN